MLCLTQTMKRLTGSNRKPEGQYRTAPEDGRSAMVYVVGGGPAAYLTELQYRAKGYKPDFDQLPTEAEYDA